MLISIKLKPMCVSAVTVLHAVHAAGSAAVQDCCAHGLSGNLHCKGLPHYVFLVSTLCAVGFSLCMIQATACRSRRASCRTF
jgi:hypothetical protein